MDRGVGHARLRGRVALSASRIAYACSDGVSCVVACLGATPAAPWAAAAAPWCSLPEGCAHSLATQRSRRLASGVQQAFLGLSGGSVQASGCSPRSSTWSKCVAKPALVFWRWPRARSLPPLITATKGPPPQTATTRSSGGLLLRFTDLRNPLFAAFIDPAEL